MLPSIEKAEKRPAHSILVSDRVKAIIDRHVASGEAEDPTVFVEDAVLHLAAERQDETAMLIAQAEKGIADIKDGRYVTIASQGDAEEFLARIVSRSSSDDQRPLTSGS